MNDIITVSGISGYIDKAGVAQLNAADVARGWGFTQMKNGAEYVRWDRVNEYLHEFGFSPQVGKDDFLPENMVYRLGFKANNETAQRFQAKLADEVLPALRKHGAYMTPETIERTLTNPDFIIRLATELKQEQEKRKALEAQAALDRPKTIFADAVSESKTSILVGDLAKLIKQNGVKIGQKRLFAWLRENGWLMKSGSSKNMPTQKAMEQKLFEIKERTIAAPDGHIIISKTPKVTGKGQMFFINSFLGAELPDPA